MSSSLFESLPAEVHENIFDHGVVETEPGSVFQPANLLVSKTYYARAERSYYQHGNIKLSGTPAGLKHFRSVPAGMKKLITSMTFTGGKIQFQVLSDIVAECPRLTNLRLEDIVPQHRPEGIIAHHVIDYYEQWWAKTSHILNLTVSEDHTDLYIFMKIKGVLRIRPTWTMAQWGKIGVELDLWHGFAGFAHPGYWFQYLNVMEAMLDFQIVAAGGHRKSHKGFMDLIFLRNLSQCIVIRTQFQLGLNAKWNNWSEEQLSTCMSDLDTALYRPGGGLERSGGVMVKGEWTFPGQ